MQNDTAHYDKCRTLMHVHKAHHRIRLIISGVLLLTNMYYIAVSFPIVNNLTLIYKTAHFGFLLGGLAVLYSAVILALIFFGVPEKPKFLLLAGLLLILGMMMHIISPVLGIAVLIVCVSQIPECRQALWIQKQQGYPHFNERFDEQMEHFGKEYQPEHHFDNVHDSEMPDINDI